MPNWLWQLIAVIIGLCAGALLLHALFRDRARGRKRCPRCWYDMSAGATLICAECGCDARRPDRLLKTRRHWKRAGVAVALGLLAMSSWRMQALRHGWPAVLPGPALAMLVSVCGDPDPANKPMGALNAGKATPWQRAQVAWWLRDEIRDAASEYVEQDGGIYADSNLRQRLKTLARCQAESRVAAPVVRGLISHDDRGVRQIACEAVGWQGVHGAMYVNDLVACADNDEFVIFAAAMSLGDIGPRARSSLDWLCSYYDVAAEDRISSPYTAISWTVATSVESVVDGDVRIMMRLLEHDGAHVRNLAIGMLQGADIPRERFIEIVTPMFANDPSHIVRETVLNRLIEYKDKNWIRTDIAPLLVDALDDEDAFIREKAAWALRRAEPRVMREPIIAALRDEPDPRARYAMLKTLTSIPPDAELVATFIRHLDDPDESVAIAAATRLGGIGAVEALPALTEMLEDDRPLVSNAARNAIRTLD